jgi:hypothetical protein
VLFGGHRHPREERDQLGAPSAAFTPCSWKNCFDVSMKMRVSFSADGLLRLKFFTTSIWHINAIRGPVHPIMS